MIWSFWIAVSGQRESSYLSIYKDYSAIIHRALTRHWIQLDGTVKYWEVQVTSQHIITTYNIQHTYTYHNNRNRPTKSITSYHYSLIAGIEIVQKLNILTDLSNHWKGVHNLDWLFISGICVLAGTISGAVQQSHKWVRDSPPPRFKIAINMISVHCTKDISKSWTTSNNQNE